MPFSTEIFKAPSRYIRYSY